jgi:nitroimidazol reductase NimA-like FMN-containing flavoprotein (pyridoxamine 5'-phosphate oxidase superfamily)
MRDGGTGDSMIEKMKALLRERRTCVLATVGEEGPHCSLMSYALAPDGTEIYLVTHRQTKKYRNLLKNPAVSLLIDTREDGTSSESTRALTVEGIFRKIENERTRLSIRGKFLEIHPLLKEFLDDPEAEIFAVRIVSLQLLDGIRDSSFLVLE